MSRKIYLDYLRAIACILVVFVHVAAHDFGSISVRSFDWNIMNLFDCAGIVGVPLFVMISGALMLDEKYELTIKKLLIKTLRLVIVFYLWLLIYNTISYFDAHAAFDWASFKYTVLKNMAQGVGMYHLWFLPMIITLYLATPVIRQIVLNRKICEYLLGLLIIIDFAIPTLLLFDIPFKFWIESIYQTYAFELVSSYLLYYCLGYYLDKHIDLKSGTACRNAIILCIISFCIQAGACSIDAWIRNEASTILNTPTAITMIPICVGLFLLFKRKNSVAEMNVPSNSDIQSRPQPCWLIRNLSRYSFGIYLIHPLGLILMERIGIDLLWAPAVITIPVTVLVCTLFSYAVAWLIGHIPGVGKYCI